jgi:predicted nuclease of predicted toxin-antitoxin system
VRLLADENVAAEVVEALRRAGHEVGWLRDDDPGAADDRVLARSVREHRVLVTLDKDFGALVFARGARGSSGVVLFRLPGLQASAMANHIVATLASRTDWEGHFSVVQGGRIRMRRLT